MQESEITYPEWFVQLAEQVPNASTDTLKAILEHTTKLLDHSYAANDAISQKARWGIGVIVAIVAVMLRPMLEPDHDSGIPWAIFGPGLLGLGAAFVLFLIILITYDQHHSGMEPRLNPHGQYIAFGVSDMQQPDYNNEEKNLDFGYVVLWTVWDYQSRITKSQKSNRTLSRLFNTGAWSMIGSFLYITAALVAMQ